MARGVTCRHTSPWVSQELEYKGSGTSRVTETRQQGRQGAERRTQKANDVNINKHKGRFLQTPAKPNSNPLLPYRELGELPNWFLSRISYSATTVGQLTLPTFDLKESNALAPVQFQFAAVSRASAGHRSPFDASQRDFLTINTGTMKKLAELFSALHH